LKNAEGNPYQQRQKNFLAFFQKKSEKGDFGNIRIRRG